MTTRGLNVTFTSIEGAQEPVTLEDLKLYLAIDTDDHNVLLNTILQGAIQEVERYTGCSLIRKTVKARWEVLTTAELPYGPVISITSVKDKDGEDREDYEIEGMLGDFAGISADSETPVVVEYVAGYDIELSPVIPPELKTAVLEKATEDFTFRGMKKPEEWKQAAKRLSRKTW